MRDRWEVPGFWLFVALSVLVGSGPRIGHYLDRHPLVPPPQATQTADRAMPALMPDRGYLQLGKPARLWRPKK